ncbi:hypothetical protein NQ315_012044 [Exocentrus adspersus]|uniref:Phospholipase A2-like domain-containing protein n=1 Tax=Exocentrus adspersus TaxID=1586481 RepID=A0AAV8VJP4_9CUCU|nr:hypothetical protein NQ315_012044 [Exocentrus adspersus]
MSTTARKSGSGILDSIINNLPVELHIPEYRFCRPGTKLAKRLSRGDVGINGLDEACKEHDIGYSREKNLEQRHKADQNLGEKALKRFKSSNASIGEKAAALAVATAMKVKTKLGMGCVNEKTKKRRGCKTRKRKAKSKRIGGSLTFKDVTKQARVALLKNMKDAIKVALKAVNKAKKKTKFIKAVRVIPIAKTGGFLSLIPIFAGLRALGPLGGGAAGIAKAVNNDAKDAKQKFEESKRHNVAMEQIAMGKGLYMKPYKQGFGLFLGPYQPSKGVFMRDSLPRHVHYNECGIINLDAEKGSGTHWAAYKKTGKEAVYFDSYGNLGPPHELIHYLNTNGPCKILLQE